MINQTKKLNNGEKRLGDAQNQTEDQSHDKALARLRWYDWPAMGLLTALMLVVFAQFVTRYLFNDSWAWTEEVSRYLLMTLVFTGCVSVVARSEHIRLEVVRQRVSTANQLIMARFANAVSLIYCLFLGAALLMLALETSQDLVSVSFPKAAIYAVIGVCLLGACMVKLMGLISADPNSDNSDKEASHD